MKSNPMTCDPDRIALFLDERLSDADQATFELHLDACPDCRRRLEAAAAEDDVWSGVRESLADGPLEDPHGESDPVTSGETAFSHAAILSLLAPTDDDRMLGRLGPYEVVGVIGSGGMGVVLKALDAALNRYVAIKLLAPHLAGSGAARKRFSREAQAAAAVVHENVMEIYGVADVDGLPYLVMPYVRGPSLERRLDGDGPLSLVEILRIGMQAAKGLAAAHAQGLVHRDVKPANILLADGVERVKLTDFGLARAADDASLTRTGFIAGTPQYMSPEQARGEAVDARSDLFSLGSVLYAMCTGRAPFRAETSYGVLRRITDDQPRPIREINPEVPEWLCRVVGRLMAKNPDQRYASADEVGRLLEQCLAHVQQPTVAPLPEELRDRPLPSKLAKRRSLAKLLAGIAGSLAILAAAVVIVLELNKGTLTIESEADDIAVRVTRGDEIVEKLTITQSGKNVRIAAGNYLVEIEGDSDGIAVENGEVKLRRGGREIVRIVKRESPPPKANSAPGGGMDPYNPYGSTGSLYGSPYPPRRESPPPKGSAGTAPTEPEDQLSLEYAVKQFNAMSANERRTLFDPPIPDLTVDRLREGFRQAAEQYRRAGKRQIAEALQKIADTGRLPEAASGGLISSGVHAQDDDGETISQQIVPSLVLPDGATRRLVVLRPLELMYKKGGPVSKDYGDLFDPNEDSLVHALEEAASIARSVASRIEELAGQYPHLAEFSADEHLKKNTSREGASIGTPENPELYSISYSHGAVESQFPGSGGPKRSASYTFDPETGVNLDIHFFRGDSRGADAGPPIRIGDVSIHVYVQGPAAEAIRGEILRILDEIARKQGSPPRAPQEWRGAGAQMRIEEIRPAFGEAQSGLELGVAVTGGRREYQNGDWVPVELFIRNVSDRKIEFAYSPRLPVTRVRSSTGEETIVRGPSDLLPTVHLSLAPGEAYGGSIGFFAPIWNPLTPGRNTVDCSLELVVDRQRVALRSGTVEFQLAAKPPAESPHPATPPTPEAPRETAGPQMLRRIEIANPGNDLLVAWSPDGKRLVVANGNPTRVLQVDGGSRVQGDWKPQVQVFNAGSGESVLSLPIVTEKEAAAVADAKHVTHVEVTSLAFSPDGKVIAAGTSIGQVKLFDAATGQLVESLDHQEHKAMADTPESWKPLRRAIGRVASLAFSPDGRLLAVCGETFEEFADVFDGVEGLGRSVTGPGRLKVWDLTTGTLKHDLVGHSQVFGVAFSPDGATLGSAGRWDDGANHGTGAIFWNVENGEKLLVKETVANGGAHWISISPDGRLAALGSLVFDKDNAEGRMGDVALFHVATGLTEWQQRVPVWGEPLFSPDGKRAVVFCGGESVRFLDAATGKMTHQMVLAGARWTDVAISPAGNVLAIAGVKDGDEGVVALWDVSGLIDPADPNVRANAGSAAVDRPDGSQTATSPHGEAREVVLSMDSLRFLLDLDTGATMDPPATARPEQKAMDVRPTQSQPYELPKGLTGLSLHGLPVSAADWNASAAAVRRGLESDRAGPLGELTFAATETATFFFRTRDGAEGVLQLLGLVEEPKGIRIRYRIVATGDAQSQTPRQ